MKTTTFYKRIAEVSNTGYSGDRVEDMLDFELNEDVGMFYVTVTGDDEDGVRLVSEALVQEMPIYIRQRQSIASFEIIDRGKVVEVE